MSDGGGPRLVFAACRAPYPLTNGGRIRTHHLLSGLARVFDTTLVTFEHHPDSPDGHCSKEELERLYPGVDVATVPGAGPHKRLSQASSLLRRGSWTNGRYMSAAYSATLRSIVRSRLPCVAHFDDLGVAGAGPLGGAFNAYSAHNIEYRLLEFGSESGSAPRRLFNSVEELKVHAEERRVWRSMDLSLAVSELDARTMAEGGAKRVELCPNGAPAVKLLPAPARSPADPLRLLFVGSGSYGPYERGLAWFVSEVMPRVRARVPVVLDVIGQPPARAVAADGVEYHGPVPSVEPFYEACQAVVVPVFEGSGTRLKMLEAMAYGRPVISTGLGAEGLPVEAGHHYLRADDASEFEAECVRVADLSLRPYEGELEVLVTHAHEAVHPLLWPSIAARLANLYLAELR
ncbi:MAG: glycosyltransferase [Thermoleophilaceae bacterium]